MTDTVFMVALAAVLAIGALSLYWVMRGMSGITDTLIKKLFSFMLALIIALITVSLVFVIWISISTELLPANKAMGSLTYLFIVAILALISGAALAAKRIGDVYGFKVGSDMPAMSMAKQQALPAAKKKAKKR